MAIPVPPAEFPVPLTEFPVPLTEFPVPLVLLAVAHATASAAWFGAMVYSLTVLHPRGLSYFGGRAERFEPLVTHLSAAARRPVLFAFGFVGLTGAAMAWLAWPTDGDEAALYGSLLAVKAALYLAALVLFVHISWRLWPRRVFASDAEAPAVQRTARRTAWAMLALIGLNFAFGVVAQYVRR